MIVSIGKRIQVESATCHHFSCDCTTPGLVICTDGRGGSVQLPGNAEEARRFVAAYLRTVDEPIDYVRSEYES